MLRWGRFSSSEDDCDVQEAAPPRRRRRRRRRRGVSSAGPSRSRLAELSEQLPHKKVEDTTSFLGPSIGLGVRLRAPKTKGRPVRGDDLHLVWDLVLTVLLLRVLFRSRRRRVRTCQAGSSCRLLGSTDN